MWGRSINSIHICITYIACEGKFSKIIETIDSSASLSAIVTGPAANRVRHD